jgi:transposase
MAHEERADGVRVQVPQRNQLEFRSYDLESTIPGEHRVRAIWDFVCRLELGRFYAQIRARGSEPGRDATDPRLLLTLWLYATSEGVGSGRELDRLCKRDDAYRWICGGVKVNYHTLSDFRFDHGEEVDELMTQLLAVLMQQGLITLKRVAQDGMRVRASAGAASFRRRKTLETCMEQARKRVVELRQEITEDPAAHVAKQRAAQERAVRERQAAIERALAELPKVEAVKQRQRETQRKKKKVGEARVSTTDPEARVMKMGDGGYRPAYNVQLATDVESRFIVGVDVTNSGSDKGQAPPMLEQVKQRTGRVPEAYLADAGFNDLWSIEETAKRGVTIYTPTLTPGRPRKAGAKSHRKAETPAITAWRDRMTTAEAQAIYKDRAATAETANADLRRWRGLNQFPSRGLTKAKTTTLWAALTHNILRWITVSGFRAHA